MVYLEVQRGGLPAPVQDAWVQVGLRNGSGVGVLGSKQYYSPSTSCFLVTQDAQKPLG